jgi:hypothetical protein
LELAVQVAFCASHTLVTSVERKFAVIKMSRSPTLRRVALDTTGADPGQMIGWHLVAGLTGRGGTLVSVIWVAFLASHSLVVASQWKAAVIKFGRQPAIWCVAFSAVGCDSRQMVRWCSVAGFTNRGCALELAVWMAFGTLQTLVVTSECKS